MTRATTRQLLKNEETKSVLNSPPEGMNAPHSPL